jgi:integrase
MLTDAAMKKLKPHKKRREVPDAHGLHLVIQPSGHKSWALRFRRPDGRTAKLTLGTCDVAGTELEGEPAIGGHLTLAAARRLVAEVNRQRALGKDVIAERRAERQHRVSARIDAERAKFPSAVRNYIEREARGRKKNRGWRNTAALLGLAYPDDGDEPTLIPGGLAERWADRDVASITSDEVFILIDEARERGVPGREVRSRGPSEARARELACALSGLFRWLRAKRRIVVDPCGGMARPEGSRKRERVLNVKPEVRRADELRWLWAAAASLGGPFGALVKLLVLTGQRRSEVAEMERRELGDDLWSWTIPSTRTKNKREHVVPISPASAEVLKGVLEDPSNRSPFVFSTNGKTPVSGFSKFKRRLDRAMLDAARTDDPEAIISPWTLHDLRRTAVTGMVEIGVEPHVVEAVVNHISGHKSGVAGVYNVAAYAEPKRKALERWAAHVEAVVSGEAPGKVVPMWGRS